MGAKRAMRGVILPSFPLGYNRYVEVFGGGASILLAKAIDKFEVYNDFNSDLVNMFRCIKERPLALFKALKLFPLHSRQEFNLLQEFMEGEEPAFPYMDEEIEITEEIFDEKDADMIIKIMSSKAELYDVERAATFYKLIRFSYGSAGKSFGGQPVNLVNTLETFFAVSNRLQTTVIENKDFEEVIKLQDRFDTFFYIDPPYVKTEDHYLVEFPFDNHIRLYNILKNINGKFLLSYNDCEFIKELYKEFTIVEHSRLNSLALRYGRNDEYKEVLIANYDINERRKNQPIQLNLFEDDYERNFLHDYRYRRPNSTTVYIPRTIRDRENDGRSDT